MGESFAPHGLPFCGLTQSSQRVKLNFKRVLRRIRQQRTYILPLFGLLPHVEPSLGIDAMTLSLTSRVPSDSRFERDPRLQSQRKQ